MTEEERDRLKRDAVIGLVAAALGAVLGAGAVYLIKKHGPITPRGESPILVRDGASIHLKSATTKLTAFNPYGLWVISHPESKWAIKHFKGPKLGGGQIVAKCKAWTSCWLEVTYTDSAVPSLIIGGDLTGNGMWVFSSVPFSSWDQRDQYEKEWVLANRRVKDIQVFGTDEKNGTSLCPAPLCEVEVYFRD